MKFANDIIVHPDKIMDLKNNYPKLYDDNFIGDVLRDTVKDKSYIKDDFVKKKYCSIIIGTGFNPYDVDNYKKHIKYQGLTKDELFGFGIDKRGKGISFEFIKHEGKYYILKIGRYRMYSGNDPMYDD